MDGWAYTTFGFLFGVAVCVVAALVMIVVEVGKYDQTGDDQ